jgi:hypothetical protein
MAKRILLAVALLSLLAVTACQPDILLRLITTVYHDGSLDRRLELRGWTDEGDVPTEDNWFAEKAGMDLAAPEDWNRITQGPGRIDAEGFYLSVDELPPVLEFYLSGDRETTDRISTNLEIDDKVVIKRWRYTEKHGDPHSREDAERALSALTELAVEALEKELRRHFGQEFNTAPGAALLRDRGRSLFSALLTAERRTSSTEDKKRFELQKQVLAQHGAPLVTADDADEFWELETPLLFDWSRTLMAEALTSDDYPIAPEDLAFWPVGDEMIEMGDEIIERIWGGEEALWELIEPHLDMLGGYYKGGDTPNFRFEVHVRLPGRLISTNGTPVENGARWLFRDEDLDLSDTFLRVESVEPIAEPLTRLGARREFSTAQLIQLADLLWRRDPQGILAERLSAAVEKGDLGHIWEAEGDTDGYNSRIRELSNLLDPDVDID